MRVKINEGSWHYRWYVFLRDKEPVNLCDYFWTCFLTIGLFSVLGIAGVGFGIFMLVKLFTWDWEWIKQAMLVVLIGIVYLLSLGGLGIGFEKLKEYCKRKWGWGSKPRKEFTFVKVTEEYLKAQKAKICPLVDIVRKEA